MINTLVQQLFMEERARYLRVLVQAVEMPHKGHEANRTYTTEKTSPGTSEAGFKCVCQNASKQEKRMRHYDKSLTLR